MRPRRTAHRAPAAPARGPERRGGQIAAAAGGGAAGHAAAMLRRFPPAARRRRRRPARSRERCAAQARRRLGQPGPGLGHRPRRLRLAPGRPPAPARGPRTTMLLPRRMGRVASRPWLRMRRGSSAAADPGPEQARAAFPGGKGPRLRPPGWSRPRPGCGSPAPQSQLVPVRHGIDESRGRRPGGAAPRATVRVRVSRRRAAARQLEGSGSDPATHARLHGHGDGLRFSPPRRRVGLHRDSFCRRDSGQGGKSPLGPAREPGPGPGPKRNSGGRAGDFPPVLPVVADAVGTTTATNAVVVVSWSRRRAGSGRQSRGRGRGPEPGEGRRPGSTGRAVAGCGPPGQYLPEMTSDRVPRPSGLGVTVTGACRRVSRLGLLPPAFEPEDARVAGVSL